MTDPVERYVAWAKTRAGVAAIALIGSNARDDAVPESDVDVLTLLDDPAELASDTAWVEAFSPVEAVATEDWGAVTSVRVHYRGGPEVEFGLASPGWAATDPVDPGTAQVFSGGVRILHDPRSLLARLAANLQ